MYNLQIDEQKTLELLRLQLKNDPTIELEEWFDNEIKNPFGIDVYKNIFDCNKGYQIINNNRCHHLLIRMENLNHCFSSAIQEFLNIDKSVNIKNVNIGENKYYANSYNRIKSEIRLELEVMEKVVSSRYFQHFYPEQEEIVRDKWLVKN
ncbi:MAG: hypothetical protein VR65_22630 [Desulfobulbaceae bacterium BRH_c16a]|nr:MAG: hypothetical protein VR65_22630 [Desulfobulbaceae bacterium BRH_c16a]